MGRAAQRIVAPPRCGRNTLTERQVKVRKRKIDGLPLTRKGDLRWPRSQVLRPAGVASRMLRAATWIRPPDSRTRGATFSPLGPPRDVSKRVGGDVQADREARDVETLSDS